MIRLVPSRCFSQSVTRLNTLALLEAAGGKVSASSLSTITAAKQLGKPITALLAGPEGQTASEHAAKIEGVDAVLVAPSEKFAHQLAEELAPLVHQIVKQKNFTRVLAPASAVGKAVLPRLAALLDVQPVSDIIQIVSDDTFVRPVYAGNALATVKSSDSVILASVRASVFAAAGEKASASAVELVEPEAESGNKTEFVSEDLVTSERPELGSAGKVVAGGRGLKNKETFDSLIEPLATKLGAAIGASRAAVDAGFCDNSLQVGQTGKIVAPELYVAVGISGAIQHLAGMKDSKTIVAINKDGDAPIFNVADIGLVADITEALPELTSKI